MHRGFLIFSVLAGVAAAGIIAMAKEGHLSTWKGMWASVVAGKETTQADDRFKVDLFDQINYNRIAAKHAPLKIDPDLQKHLERYLNGAPCDDLNLVTEAVQAELPRYFRVSACTATKPSHTDLLHEFGPFAQKTEPEMTHLACVLIKSTGGLSQTCLLVAGQRLEDFSPELLSEQKTDSFFNYCSHCGHPHICRVSKLQRSQTLECPDCGKTYAVVASDSHGRFRYVNEFLSGYQPPARFPKDQSRVQELFTIWSAVHAHCTYRLDPETKKQSQLDCWQTAVETQNLQQGDCEDSSIFLADWLTARGFQVRVALGRYGDMGGHAWCVVRLDGSDYLLESTEGRPDLSNPPLADLIGSRYLPEVLFDRKAIYVRGAGSAQTWKGDYWSQQVWSRVDPRQSFAVASRNRAAKDREASQLVSSAHSTSRFIVERDRLTMARSPEPAMAPFIELETVPAGPNWQLTVHDEFERKLQLQTSR